MIQHVHASRCLFAVERAEKALAAGRERMQKGCQLLIVLACAPSAAIFLVRDPSVLEQCPASEHPHRRFGAKSDRSEREDGWTQGGMRWAGLARYVRSQCLPHLPSLSPSFSSFSLSSSLFLSLLRALFYSFLFNVFTSFCHRLF